MLQLLIFFYFVSRFETASNVQKLILWLKALFGWLAPSQPAVLFSHTSSAPAISHQPASSIFLSQ
jgi:hypothetical protein